MMDRTRRGSVIGSGDPRQRTRQLPPVASSSAGTSRMGETQTKYGEMVEPQLYSGTKKTNPPIDEDTVMIDPNLLVGPLYTGSTDRRSDRIKEQLTDITEKLHKTLHTFDEFDEFTPGEDPLVVMMKKKIMQVDDPSMQSHLSTVMYQYEDMAQQLKDANSERDEMLFQLADWFTTDHLDIEDIKTTVNESDEQHIKEGYFETMANFEKLKKLQQKIGEASMRGKPTAQLVRKKVELERDVVQKFRNMKDMSMQTMKFKIDDAPWKHAAHEVVTMLKNVRSENAEELKGIQENMKAMINELEKQALTIKSLLAELREKKEIVKKLTGENSDLTEEVELLKAKQRKYRKDLAAARMVVHSMQEPTEEALPPLAKAGEVSGPIQQTVTAVLSKLEVSLPEVEVKEVGSDPAVLQTQIKELQEELDHLRVEYERKNDDLTEMAQTLQEKREYIESIEAENEKYINELKKLRAFRRQSLAAEPAPPAEGEGFTAHQCEHCHCHIPLKEVEEEIEELKTEVKRWQDKCTYFKKSLADTEMRLSDAYKEISDLRMDREPAPTPKSKEIPKPKPKEMQKELPREKPAEKKEPAKPAEKAEPEKLEGKEEPSEPKRRKVERRKPERVKPEPKSRYKQEQHIYPKADLKLPPIEKRSTSEVEIKPKTAMQRRELNLYRVGDLQGRLNLLSNEIMEFVVEVGKMLYTDKEEVTKRVQTMTAFTFDSGIQKKEKEKEAADPKDLEGKQKKNQVMFLGQQAMGKLREAYDMLSHSLALQHNEYEAIYRSFKISQRRQSIRREIIHGRLPVSALEEFDEEVQLANQTQMGEEDMLVAYYNAQYGGGFGTGGMMITNKPRTLHRKRSSSSIRSGSPETEAKLRETANVLRMQRSRSDLDVRAPDAQGFGLIHGSSMIKDSLIDSASFSQILDVYKHEDSGQVGKQEVKISKAVVPRRGLIQLSTDDKDLHVTGGKQITPTQESKQQGSGKTHPSLIRRKDILEQVKLGTKLLEEYEEKQKEEEEMTKSLGEYTMLDLQSHILGLTDARGLKRESVSIPSSEPLYKELHKEKQPARGKKPVVLPAINTLNPFG